MAEINKIIKDARDVLVGKIPDPQAQIDQITMALIYKFMDAKDMEALADGLDKTFFVGEYEKYAFDNIMKATNNNLRYEMYVDGIEKMQYRTDLPATFTSVFKDAFIPYKDAATLHLFLSEINKIPTDNTELLGTAFEDLLSIMGSQGDAGQFRTPRHIIDMMVEIVNPEKNETILDPACGTAGFLISAYSKIAKEEMNPQEKKFLVEDGLVGYDINPNMVKLASVNLFLHNCRKPNIHLYDTLSEKDFWNIKYDVILANPPFMSPKGGIRPHGLFDSINANRSEVLFTYYIAKHLNENGRAGVIVPEGIVFQTANAYKNIRKLLVDDGFLYGVISLPSGVFNPYSGVKTSILLFDREIARKSDKVIFVKMNSDGYDLGAQRRKLNNSGGDISKIIELCKEFLQCSKSNTEFVSDSELVTIASKEQIKENDYVLVGDRYKEKKVYNSNYPMVKIGDFTVTSSGGTPLKSVDEYYENGNIPWVTSGEVSKGFIYENKQFITDLGMKNSSAKLFPKNTVLVAMYGATVGEVGVLKIEATTNQAVCGIYPNDKILPEYLYSVLKAKKDKLISMSVGGAQPNISQAIIKSVKIPLPSIEIQKEIVAEIKQYQSIIDGARKVVDNYKPNISYNSNWKKYTLKDIISFNPKKSEIELSKDKEVSFVPMQNVNANNPKFNLVGNKKLEEVYSGYTYFKDGDVLLAKVTPCFENGKSAIANGLMNGIGFGSSEFYVLRADVSKTLPGIIYSIINSLAFIDAGKNQMTGTGGLKRLNKDYVLNYEISLPSLPEQQEIVAKIEEEQKYVDGCKKLIEIYEQKIKDKIATVWGE